MNEPIDWGTRQERLGLAWAPRVPKDVRGTPKHLRANLEFLTITGSVLIVGGLLAGVGDGAARAEPIVLGALGWLIAVPVAIRLWWLVRHRHS